MSYWTHITGAIEVSVPGRTQAEIDYILQTILDHLPRVTGSEGDMEIHINRHKGSNCSSSCDEYQMNTNNLEDRFGKSHRGWLETQSNYTLTVHADLRDRVLSETVREFTKWLCRLSKRLYVDTVLVQIRAYGKRVLIDDAKPYHAMHESPSWAGKRDGDDFPEPAWWEHLVWRTYGDWALPLEHIVKYYDCPEADAEFKKRLADSE